MGGQAKLTRNLAVFVSSLFQVMEDEEGSRMRLKSKKSSHDTGWGNKSIILIDNNLLLFSPRVLVSTGLKLLHEKKK